VADELYKAYNLLILACLRSYGRPQAPENFRRIIASLVELREAWEFVDAAAARAPRRRRAKAGSSESPPSAEAARVANRRARRFAARQGAKNS